jgi:hypothetical protein
MNIIRCGVLSAVLSASHSEARTIRRLSLLPPCMVGSGACIQQYTPTSDCCGLPLDREKRQRSARQVYDLEARHVRARFSVPPMELPASLPYSNTLCSRLCLDTTKTSRVYITHESQQPLVSMSMCGPQPRSFCPVEHHHPCPGG